MNDLPIRAGLRWVHGLIAFYALMPLIIWMQSIENLSDYFGYSLPPGQLAYIFSKLMGLYALSLLSLQIVVGLLLPKTGRRHFHQYLGLCSLAALLIHASLFVCAASLRSGHLALHLFLPKLFATYYEFGVSMGVIGFWVILIVVVAGVCRLSGFKSWRWLHYLAFPAFIVIYTHGLLIGSDTRILITNLFYGVIALTIALALWNRWQWAWLR